MASLRRPMMVLAAVAVVALLLVAGCSPAKSTKNDKGDSKPASATPSANASASVDTIVKATDKGFTPQVVTIRPRSRVIWENTGKNGHNVTFADGKSSGNIPPGQRASHIFSQLGTYEYKDKLHPEFTGTVKVQ